MKLQVHAKSFESVESVLTPEQVEQARGVLKALDECFWVRRDKMAPGRAMPGEDCLYDFAAQTTLPEVVLDYLISLAPEVDDLELDEVCINRYLPGHYIGKHVDKSHPVNMVVALQSNDKQGCLAEGVLIPDVAGRAVVHPSMSVIHSVPVIEEERYVLIFLYTFVGALQCRHATIRSKGLNP